jgi:hypothetical protein
MPVYPTGYRAPASVASAPPPAPVHETELPNPTSIPTNSDEYAKALQEAYRKGAEAAARMAQQQQHLAPQQHIQTAASCPDFSAQEERPPTYPVHPTPTSISADALATSSMPPPPPQHPHAAYGTTPSQPLTLSTALPPSGHYSSPPPTSSHHHAPPPPYASLPSPTPTAPTAQPNPPPPQGRSMSMPDMASYAVQAEEEKRQKRLARNRQSARLRRQRKKNLVRKNP